jgi:hypothetical protein
MAQVRRRGAERCIKSGKKRRHREPPFSVLNEGSCEAEHLLSYGFYWVFSAEAIAHADK